MNHKISLDYIIFWSSILTFLVLSHTANGILTDSNDLQCTHIQCPTKCPADSYLKSSLDDEEEDFEDYDDELLGHDPFIEEIGHFEELPPEVELHDTHLPQHILKERQKREVFFQEEIERCCDDQKCVCNTCENVPKCAEGHVAIEVHEGQGVPGNCCSIYKCVKKEECKLGVKQSWWTSKCTKCSCFGESELCMQICPEEEILQNCYSEYLQKPMMNGAFWKEGSCTSCSCEQGDRRCLTPVCPKLACKHTITFEDECCPKCLDDDETDERPEIIHNNAEEIEDVAEEYATESTTIDTPIIKLNEDNNTSIFIDNSNFPVVDDSIINESQTTSPAFEAKESSTVFVNHETLEEIYSTFKPETEDLLMHNSSNTENATLVSVPKPVINSTLISVLENEASLKTSTEEPKSIVEQNLHSSIETSTEMPKSAEDSSLETSTNVPKSAVDSSLETSTADTKSIVEVATALATNISTTEVAKTVQELDEDYTTTESTTAASRTEEPKSKVMLEIEQDLSSTVSTTEEVVTSPATSVTKTTTETPEESALEETTTPESSITNTTEENLTTTSANYIEESSSIVGDMLSSTVSTTAAPIDFETTKALESSTEINHISTTHQPPETTVAYSFSFSTSEATESSESQESSSIINMISSPTLPNTTTKTTTNTPLDSTSTETSTQHSPSSSTSTTSSPFSNTQDDSTTSVTASSSIWEESTSSSTTTAPEPLKPLYQPYGDFNSEERTPSTQNQMRIIFDEIDYVVMIVLFIGSILCISLGLIIRHTKNRKKMYSSIPNSETSLSQNSTNTVMTV